MLNWLSQAPKINLKRKLGDGKILFLNISLCWYSSSISPTHIFASGTKMLCHLLCPDFLFGKMITLCIQEIKPSLFISYMFRTPSQCRKEEKKVPTLLLCYKQSSFPLVSQFSTMREQWLLLIMLILSEAVLHLFLSWNPVMCYFHLSLLRHL